MYLCLQLKRDEGESGLMQNDCDVWCVQSYGGSGRVEPPPPGLGSRGGVGGVAGADLEKLL